MPRVARACFAVLGLIPGFCTNAVASADVCEDPKPYSRFSLAYLHVDDAAIDQRRGTIARSNPSYDVFFETGGQKFLFGAGHRYDIFDVDPLQPETNGHLHTIFLPLHVKFGDDRRNFRVSVAPAVSASSNVVNKPDEYTSDAFQILAALMWRRRFSERLGLRFGVCGDHRFGEYRVYPVLGIQWQPHPDWEAQLGFPESHLGYRISDDFSSRIRIAPDGNEWYVLDRTRTRSSEFIYESYAIEWTLDWQFLERLTMTAGIGRQFRNRHEMTLIDQSRVKLSSGPVTRIGVAVEWRF